MVFLDVPAGATQFSFMTALTVTKKGTISLPVKLRRKLGLDKSASTKLQVEVREDGLLLRSPAAMARRVAFIRRVNAEYTPAVRAQTLRINEEYPIHDPES